MKVISIDRKTWAEISQYSPSSAGIYSPKEKEVLWNLRNILLRDPQLCWQRTNYYFTFQKTIIRIKQMKWEMVKDETTPKLKFQNEMKNSLEIPFITFLHLFLSSTLEKCEVKMKMKIFF